MHLAHVKWVATDPRLSDPEGDFSWRSLDEPFSISGQAKILRGTHLFLNLMVHLMLVIYNELDKE